MQSSNERIDFRERPKNSFKILYKFNWIMREDLRFSDIFRCCKSELIFLNSQKVQLKFGGNPTFILLIFCFFPMKPLYWKLIFCLFPMKPLHCKLMFIIFRTIIPGGQEWYGSMRRFKIDFGNYFLVEIDTFLTTQLLVNEWKFRTSFQVRLPIYKKIWKVGIGLIEWF